jgi:hypothetical protein
MIRGVISAAGLAAEFAVYQCHGYFAGLLAATAIVAGVIEIVSGSSMRAVVDRLTGAHLPETGRHEPDDGDLSDWRDDFLTPDAS